MRRPLTIPFCLTCITLLILNDFNYAVDLLPPLITITLGSFLTALLARHYRLSIFFISLFIALTAGMKFLEFRDDHTRKKECTVFIEDYVTIRGKVLGFPEIGNGTSAVNVRILNVKKNLKSDPAGLNIRIIVSGDLRHLAPGDEVIADILPGEDHPRQNLFEDGPEISYALVRGIHRYGYSKSSLFVEKISGGNILMAMTRTIRERVRSLIEKVYSDGNGIPGRGGQLLEALLLGDRSRLSPEIRESLIASGVLHLFAISGAHIGIIAFLTLFFLKKTLLRNRTRYLILISVLLFFLMLTGFKVSAQRAVMMAVLFSLARMLYLKADMLNIVSCAGLFMLLAKPVNILDPGFVLTFTVTTGIISGRNLFLKRFPTGASPVKELLCANGSASLISLPLSLFFFMRYSFTGFFAGLVLLPFTGVLMGISLPLIPLSFLPAEFASLFFHLTKPFTGIFFFLTDSFSGRLDLSLFRAPPSPVLVFMSLFLYFFICHCGRFPRIRILLIISFLAVFLFIIIGNPPYSPPYPEVFFLDVGQGDSQIVVFPGGDALLIDGGGAGFGDHETGRRIVLPFILKNNLRIKWVAVTHYHPDHCRGVNEIIGILKPDEVLISSVPDDNALYRSLIDRCSENRIKVNRVSAGFHIEAGGARIELLYPFEVLYPFRTSNDHSQVFRLSYRGKTVLFTGDIEKEAEAAIVKRYGIGLKSDILKVPHHGSGTSSTSGFIEAVHPEYAVFSLGYRNSFGFPGKKVMARLCRTDTFSFFTSESGGIRVALRPDGFSITTSGIRNPRHVNF